jgi:hypothetical protein
VLALLDGRELATAVAQAASLLATVLGQDLQTGSDGVFRIVRRVAKDRVISTVDPDTRHGHKTSARGFDGYKGHTAVDPDSEIITATVVTPGNAGDAGVAEDLVADLLVADLLGRHQSPPAHRDRRPPLRRGRRGERPTGAGLPHRGDPAQGQPGKARQPGPQHRSAFRRTVKWRTGSEARISIVKRHYGWDRSHLDDFDGARICTGHGVLTHNLVISSA